MQALIGACMTPDFPARVAVVISNNPEAQGLNIAAAQEIPVATVNHKDYANKAEFENALQQVLSEYHIDLICLAGFMRLLSSEFIADWPNKIINIHPSLLPAYKGLDTHERVLADGASESGCSVHFVTSGMDEGPVILQKKVPVFPDDTVQMLTTRILEQEHIIYPLAVRFIAEGRIRTIDGKSEIQ